jgi:hypothetical protein
MKTEYEYLIFVEVPNPGKKTRIFNCTTKNGGGTLGIVKWFGNWRQYCYFPSVQATYSYGCLIDIADFMKQLKTK